MGEAVVINSEEVSKKTKDEVTDLVLHTIAKEKQVLIFNSSKSNSEASAERIYNALDEKNESKELEDLSNRILKSLPNPTKQCKRLAKIASRGAAFHHSGLTSKQRTLVEKAFKEGLIKVISSTPTLAAGLNLPAYKVIVKDYKRYSSRGYVDIPVLEYHQMSGRAGRPGKEDVGKAVIFLRNQEELDKVVPKYVFGGAEEIVSKLAVEPTLKMYLLSLVSMDMINSKKEIQDFFANTLYAHQYEDLDSLNHNLFRVMNVLKEYKFVDQEDDYYRATPLGRKVSELYLNPDTAHYFYDNIEKFFEKFSKKNINKHDIYDLINFIVNTVEMKPYFRVSKIQEEDYVTKLENVGDDLTVSFNPFEKDYAEFLNTLKTTDVFMDWISEAPEDYISEKYKVTPGELNYKNETIDWLLYCLEEISIMKKNYFFKNFLNRLRIRFKGGIREELIALISLKGIGRVRARTLYKAGFKKLADLRNAEFAQISRAVGDSLAIKIKEQLNEKSDYVAQENPYMSSEKPKEIQYRAVSDDEVEELVMNHEMFEKEKEEKNTTLDKFF